MTKGVRHTRVSAAWAAVAVVVILCVALVAFLAQNTRSVQISFFGASGHPPIAVALFAAALVGALIVLAVGIARTAQLRIAARRQANAADHPAVPAAPATPERQDAASPGNVTTSISDT